MRNLFPLTEFSWRVPSVGHECRSLLPVLSHQKVQLGVPLEPPTLCVLRKRGDMGFGAFQN